MLLAHSIKDILVLAPHTDDGEIGCGGFIAHCVENGFNVHYIAFSSSRISLPEGCQEDVLREEVKEATKVLGILPQNLKIFDYPTRRFAEHRQEILDDMIKLKNEISPQLILAPSLNDIHQDHQTIAKETLRCFKKQSILCYEEPWNNIAFSTNCFIKLDQSHVDKKIAALACYKSQAHRPYLNKTFIQALAVMRGTQLEGGFAEAFEVIRWML